MNKTRGGHDLGFFGTWPVGRSGMAIGAKLNGQDFNVYVLLGDGELQEGLVWEAAMAAAQFRLDNLVAIIDYNGLQLDGTLGEVVGVEPLVDKWRSFGWTVFEIDGHDMEEILSICERARKTSTPVAIIAHTVKGKGVSYMEHQVGWHGAAPTRPSSNKPWLSWMKKGADLMTKPMATRQAFGEALLALGAEREDFVVLGADLGKAMFTSAFQQKYPHRLINFGIAEQNLMTAAAGLATVREPVVACTYAVFAAMRACEQLRTMICYQSQCQSDRQPAVCTWAATADPPGDGRHQGSSAPFPT